MFSLVHSQQRISLQYTRASNGRQNVELWEILNENNEQVYNSSYVTRNDEPVVVGKYGAYKLRMHSLDGQFARNSWIRFKREGYTIFQSYFKEGEFPLSIKWPIGLDTWFHYSLTYQPSWYDDIVSDWPSYGDYTSLPEDQSALVWYFSSSFLTISPVVSYTTMFNYQYGVVAYFNGKEIYRDHLPSGPIMPTTPATTFYPKKTAF